MIVVRDLEEAIAECQGVRNPNANTCIKLASYYTILDHITKTSAESIQYSFDSGSDKSFGNLGDSPFLREIEGKNMDGVVVLMDELMQTIQVISPRLYDGVMRKLKEVD